jgi:Fe-S cluster biogenesis protein NfuA
LHLLSAARSRFGLVLAVALFAAFAVPAIASAAKFPLVLEKAGTGQGTVTSSPSGISCGTTCSLAEAEFSEGTKVTLTASPKTGSVFAGWFGCDAEPSPTKCEVTITEEITVAAEFNEIEKFFLTLEKAGTGTGTVTSSPSGINCGTACAIDEAEYAEGTKVTLTASASAGSTFEGWTGCDAEPSPTKCEVTILGETIVGAEFDEIPKFPLVLEKTDTGQGTVTSSPSGISCGTACSLAEAEYAEGTKVTLTASASAGSTFEGWTGCDAEPSPTKCEVTILGETIVGAEFDEIPKSKFMLKVKRVGTGTGKVTSTPAGINCGSTCEAEFEEGTKVALSKSADPGSKFVEWTGACTGTGACEVTMSAAKEVNAKFDLLALKKFKLTVSKPGTGTGKVTSTPAGINCGSTCEAEFEEGKAVTLAQAADSGSEFVKWTGACTGTGACEVTMSAAKEVNAEFRLKDAAKPPPTCATDPSLCPPTPGKAKASGSAQVKGGKAALKLSCSGGPCQGKLSLTARVKRAYKTTNAVIGKASFSLADGVSATLKVKLISVAKQELDKGKTIRAKLTGGAIVSSTVKLKPVKK